MVLGVMGLTSEHHPKGSNLPIGRTARPAGVVHTLANRGTAWIRFVEIEKPS
jgi:hypothetical protein